MWGEELGWVKVIDVHHLDTGIVESACGWRLGDTLGLMRLQRINLTMRISLPPLAAIVDRSWMKTGRCARKAARTCIA